MKPNTNKGRVVSALLAVIICMAAFSVSVTAADYYASDEYGNNTPPDAIDSITVESEHVKLPENRGDGALTPDGNLSLIDDILQDSGYFVSEEGQVDNKQFITVQSKSGNYFYLVIDRSGETENVYFLNLVDEADLFALLETGEETAKPAETEPEPVCICEDKCVAGEVNMKCEVCKNTMKDCEGKEEVQTTPVPEPETQKKNNSFLLLLPLLLIGGGAAWYFKIYKPKQQNKGKTDLDDYDFGEDDDSAEPVEYEDTIETEEEQH